MSRSEINTVFLTYTTLGAYLDDPQNIKDDYPNKADNVSAAIDALIPALITEAHSIDLIKTFDLSKAKKLIMKSHDDCVTSRRELEATQAAEDIAQAAAIAANVALVAASWTLFGAIGLGIAAIAAEATAQGIEMEVKHMEGNITQEISDMGVLAYNDPSLAGIKTYHEAADNVTLQLSIIGFGGNKSVVRQALLGLAKTSGTAEKLRKNLIEFYNLYNDAPQIIGKYKLLAELLIKGDGGLQAQGIIKDLKNFGIAPTFIRSTIFTFAALGLASAGMVKKFTKQAAAAFEAEGIASLEEMSEVISLTVKAERMAKCVKALAAVGAALETALLVITIIDQRKVIDQINKGIEDRKNDLIAYYTNFHNALTAQPSNENLALDIDTVLPGHYECHLYDNTPNKNDWHYVTIRKVSDTVFKWTNRAAVSWTLTKTSDHSVMKVSEDCPYYNFDDGTQQTTYHTAKINWSGNRVASIVGPWGEHYDSET